MYLKNLTNYLSKQNKIQVLSLIYSSLSKMVDKKFALIFSIVLSLEPFFLGVSRFLHLSALTAMFMFASFAVLLEHYITKRKDYRYFVFSAILLGLGILTKIDALIVLPINGLCIAFYKFRESISRYKIINLIKNGLLYLIITAGIFYALFPS